MEDGNAFGGVSYAGVQTYSAQSAAVGESKPMGTGGGMEWLTAIGAVGGLGTAVTGVIHAWDGTDRTVAQAQQTAAQAQVDAVAAQREANKLAAAANRDMMVYGLVGVGVVVAGAVAWKALA